MYCGSHMCSQVLCCDSYVSVVVRLICAKLHDSDKQCLLSTNTAVYTPLVVAMQVSHMQTVDKLFEHMSSDAAITVHEFVKSVTARYASLGKHKQLAIKKLEPSKAGALKVPEASAPKMQVGCLLIVSLSYRGPYMAAMKSCSQDASIQLHLHPAESRGAWKPSCN